MDGLLAVPGAPHQALAAEARGSIYVFTPPNFVPSFQLITRRDWLDQMDALKLARGLSRPAVLRILEHSGLEVERGAGEWSLQWQASRALWNNRLKTFKFPPAYRDQLTDPRSPILANMSGVRADDSWRRANATAADLRQAIALELTRLLAERWREKEVWDNTFRAEPWYNQLAIAAGAATVGAGEFVGGIWDTGAATIRAVGSAANTLTAAGGRAIELTIEISDAVLSGNLDKIRAMLASAGHTLKRGLQEVKEMLAEAARVLKLLLDEPSIGRMLLDYCVCYVEATAFTEKIRMAATVTLDVLLTIALACISGPVGVAAGAANSLRKVGQFSARLLQMLAELYRRLIRPVGRGAGDAGSRGSRPRAAPAAKPDATGNDSAGNQRDSGKQTQGPTETNGDKAASQSTPGEVDNGKVSATEACTSTRGCPISMVTGEELLSQIDFEIPGPLPLVWRRFYRSGQNRDRGLGHGWTYPGSERLTVNGRTAHYEDGEGRSVAISVPAVGGEATENLLERMSLRADADGRYRLTVEGEPERVFAREQGTGYYRMVERRDRNGNGWSFHYEGARLLSIRSSWGTELALVHGSGGRITAVLRVDQDGQPSLPPLVRYQYDHNGDLISATDRAGASERFVYRNHVFIQRTLKSGFSYYFEWDRYDIHGRCLRQWGDDGIYDYRFEWDPANRTSRSINSHGGVELFEYNAAGLTTREVDPEGGETRFEYDDNGRLLQRTEPDGAVWRYAYDGKGRLIESTNPLGASYRLGYDAEGRANSISDPKGQLWRRHYNERGQLAASVDPLGGLAHYRYDEGGRLIEIVPALGRAHILEWDERHRLMAETDPLGRRTEYRYDHEDRICEVIAASGAQTHYDYDPMGRVTGVRRPDGSRVVLAYDASGRLTRYVDGIGRETRYEYGGLSQVEARIDPNGARFEYEYDQERNLTALINENGERYSLAYDRNDRLVEEVGFDGRRQRYEYSPAGHLLRHTDVDVETRFERDRLGRLKTKTGSDGSFASFSYDPLGRLMAADNAARFLSFEYDPLGRLTGERQDAHQLRHAYDALGRRVAMQGPAGVLSYLYGENGTPERIERNGALLAEFLYDALGREIGRVQGALETQYEYDPAGRLARHCATHKDGGREIIGRDYGYDAAGRLSSLIDLHQGATHYHYDALDRLTRVEGLLVEPFAFDPAGNLLRDANGEARSEAGNRLSFHGDRHFSYDSRGNLVEERRGKGGRRITRYEYNAFNQLTAIERDGQRSEYAYDALGRRVEKITAAGTTAFLWDGDTLYGEHGEDSSRYFVYEPGSFRPLVLLDGETVYHYHLDHLGTPRELSDSDGTIVWQTGYRAYGSTERLQASVSNPLRFQGQYFDDETGLHYNRHRYYDPASGRFVHQDPIGLQGGENLYGYCINPVAWIDPMGLSPDSGDCQGSGISRNFAPGVNPNLSINTGSQNKHIPGTNEYKTASAVTLRSPLEPGVDPQALVNRYAGTGQAANNAPLGQVGSVERIKTSEVIGTYVDKGVVVGPTTNFTIRYGNKGVHIIPARP